MFEFRINLQPVLEAAIRELKAAAGEETEKLMKDLAIDAPNEMRSLMDTAQRSGRKAKRTTGEPFTRSARGEIPGIESFDLYDSMRGEADKNSLTLYFAEEAKYLDPVFGGYLNRPFIEKGLENAVKNLQSA